MTKSVLMAAIVSAAMAACAADDGETGDVAVALTAPGADGASYRLTPGARVALYGGPFYDEFVLDGDQQVQRIQVPPGAYQAELVHNAGYTTEWPLERTNLDGTIDTVNATLTTVMPASVDVLADEATPLVLTFVVEGVGPITFAHGAVDVSVDVDEVPADGYRASAVGPVELFSVLIDPTAPPEITTRLPAVGQVVDLGAVVRTTGPWVWSAATGACAPAELVGYSTGGHSGFTDLVTEAVNGTFFQLCVYTFEGTSQIQMLFFKTGAAFTATFSDLGAQDYSFLTYVTIDVPTPIFVGDTLHLEDLVGTQALPATVFSRVSARPAGSLDPRARWYRGIFSGTMTFTFGS